MNFIVSIGLETHVQLKTASKMFCGCKTSFADAPNTNVCPICLGYPGALPLMNREAVKLTVLSGLMLGCKISDNCKFDRKNYFYPDASKNYQISQYDQPLCLGGAVEIQTPAGPKTINLTRIHLEEDVAKNTHHPLCSGVDFNRAGTPLMEIVSEPEMSSAEEAVSYLRALRQILVYTGVSDCNLEEGNMRCDVNVSIRPAGTEKLGTKVEIKNMNSFSHIQEALRYEIVRQERALVGGVALVQETRRWDPETGETASMRSKENAHDYRYFPEPDLLPIALPNIFDAMRLGFGIGWGYIILAEMVDMGSFGVGTLILTSQRRGPREDIYLVLIAIVLMAFITDKIWDKVGQQLFPYRSQKR